MSLFAFGTGLGAQDLLRPFALESLLAVGYAEDGVWLDLSLYPRVRSVADLGRVVSAHATFITHLAVMVAEAGPPAKKSSVSNRASSASSL